MENRLSKESSPIENQHWYSNLLETDRFEIPTTTQYFHLLSSEDKMVWIVRSQKSILGYFGPFNSPDEATAILKRDPSLKPEKIHLKDLK